MDSYQLQMMSYGDHVQYDMVTRKDGKRVPSVCAVIKGVERRVPAILPCCCGCGQEFSIDLFQINKDHTYGVNYTSLPCRAHRSSNGRPTASPGTPKAVPNVVLKEPPVSLKTEKIVLPKPKLLPKPSAKLKPDGGTEELVNCVAEPVAKPSPLANAPLEQIVANAPLEQIVANAPLEIPNLIDIGAFPASGSNNALIPTPIGADNSNRDGSNDKLVRELVRQNALLAEQNTKMLEKYADLCSGLLAQSTQIAAK